MDRLARYLALGTALWCMPVWAENPPLRARDEGAQLSGVVFSVNCVGASIACSKASAVELTVTADGTVGGGWTDDGASVSLTTNTDNVSLGTDTAGGKLFLDGDTDEIQLQIQSNATQTTLPFVLEDSGGVDQVTMAESGVLTVNEEGNTGDPIFRVEGDTLTALFYIDATNQQVGIGLSPTTRLEVNEVNTATSGNSSMVQTLFELEPTGARSGNPQALNLQLQVDTAQTLSGNVVGFRVNTIVSNTIAATLNNATAGLVGGLFTADVEDATVTVAQGMNMQIPLVDTGSCATCVGLDIQATTIGAGSATSIFGIRLPAINQGATDNVHIQPAGATPIIRLGTANAVYTIQDSAANTLATLTDGGTQGNLALTGTFVSSLATSLGWSVVDQTDNQACTTGCTNACVFGWTISAGVILDIVDCADTTADKCACAGAS